jgi:hypothetical protein
MVAGAFFVGVAAFLVAAVLVVLVVAVVVMVFSLSSGADGV